MTLPRITFLALLLAALLPGAAHALALPAVEEISLLHSSLTVHENASVSVVEEITAFFPEPRHGIDREIPIRYRTEEGNLQSVLIRVRGVTDGAGGAVHYALSRQGDSLRIRIGDPDRTVTGSNTYRISYDVERALLFFPDHDELYWNATGDRWRLPIRKAIASVTVPPGVDEDGVTADCYTGPLGSKEHDCVGGVAGGSYIFIANDTILTVAVGWPKGFVHAPTVTDLWRNFFFDNIGLLAPILVFVGMFAAWWTRGRDPKTGTVIAEYEPPDRLSPAEVDALKDEGAGNEAIAASIVDFAVRGYLTIREEETGLLFKGKTYSFDRTEKDAGDLSKRERDLLDALFHGKKTVRLEDLQKDSAFQTARTSFLSEVLKDLTHGGYFARNPQTEKTLYTALGVILFFAVIAFSEIFTIWLGTASFIGLLVSAGLVILFGRIMPRRLPRGAEALRKARGFKLYLETAERHRIAWQEKEKMFEKFLPYAMVYGVVGKWTAAFKDEGVKPPAWYAGAHGVAFEPASFGSSMASFGSATASAIAPKSSGSSGGGSSGGGFGGGGGGSW